MIRRIQLTMLMWLIGVWAMASDTSVKNADGVEIWYDFDSSAKTASVTYKGDFSSLYSNEYTGVVVIPSKVTYNGVEYSVTSIGDYAFRDCRGLTSVTIGEGVTEIGSYAFNGCSGLTRVTIPESVTSIGGSAFRDCSGLTSVTIPESVTSIGGGAFYGCSGLTSVTIPESVTSIGEGAFYGCSGLTSVTIPESVTSIGGYAFYGCSGLTSVTIPESVTSIGLSAFSCCSGLTSVTIPKGVTSIGGSAFSGCSGLTSVTISEGVTSIGGSAFSVCSGLTSVTIPESVTSIGVDAFYKCRALTSITSKNIMPPTAGGYYVFYYVDKSIPLYVPAESVEAYKSAYCWGEFTNILPIQADGNPISEVRADNISVRPIGNNIVVTGTDNYTVYSISGQSLGKVTNVERGIYIVVAEGKSYKVAIR